MLSVPESHKQIHCLGPSVLNLRVWTTLCESNIARPLVDYDNLPTSPSVCCQLIFFTVISKKEKIESSSFSWKHHQLNCCDSSDSFVVFEADWPESLFCANCRRIWKSPPNEKNSIFLVSVLSLSLSGAFQCRSLSVDKDNETFYWLVLKAWI